jgi:hypothetical protein
MLIAFRAVQGIGGATIFATSLALLAQTFNEILLISGLLAIVGGVLAFPLIRRKDFHVHVPEGGAEASPEGEPPESTAAVGSAG